MIQKKMLTQQRMILVEGISKKIRREFENIADDIGQDIKKKNQNIRQDYHTLCQRIQELSKLTNDCFNLWIGDCSPIVVAHRNPLILLKYCQTFISSLLQLKKSEQQQRKIKKIENDSIMAGYNQNNIYQLLAKKNIEFLEINAQIKELQHQLTLSHQRTFIAEEMTQSIKQSAEEMLQVYRQNFVKLTELLQKAEEKESQLLQSNKYLSQDIQNLNLQFDLYKKNYKIKATTKNGESRLKERLQKQYDQKIKLISKQIEYQHRNMQKIK